VTEHGMRTLLKKLGILPILPVYFILSGTIRLLPLPQKTKRDMAIRLVSRCARILLYLFGIRVQVKHRERLHRTGNGRLIVSNHLSYIDILVISAFVPSVFITSVELRNTALLGTLARLSGSIFVERRRPAGLKNEIKDIVFALGQCLPVVLFPEGTTSNGDRVQPFKISLFDSAVMAHADILPVCLRYTGVNGARLTTHNRDNVFYYGGISFLKHFPKLLSLRSIEVEVIPLKAIRAHPGQSRKDLAAETFQAISEAYHG
jgi:1-acyl-sn-glycerol-3-phosphate acyltransferase